MDLMVSTNRGIAAGGALIAFGAVLAFLGALASVAWFALGVRPRPLAGALARYALLSVLVLPMALAIVPAFWPSTLLRYYAALLPLYLGITAALLLLPARRALLLALTGLCVFLLVDLLRGGHWLAFSVLSDFAIVGTRFHGLANEYMGIFVGACLMATLLFWEWRGPAAAKGREWLVLVVGALCAFIVSWPTLGDNAGGVPTAVFGFGTAWLLLRGGRLTGRRILAMLLASFAAILLFSVADSLGPHPTHLGKTALLMRQEGLGYVAAMAGRKLAMNWSFATDPRAIWTYLGAAALVLLALRRGASGHETLFRRRPIQGIATVSGLMAGAAAFVLEDTGIVPAALVWGSLTVTLAMALLEETSQAVDC